MNIPGNIVFILLVTQLLRPIMVEQPSDPKPTRLSMLILYFLKDCIQIVKRFSAVAPLSTSSKFSLSNTCNKSQKRQTTILDSLS